MKTLVIIGVLVLSGCAHVRVQNWDAKNGIVTTCGNRWADMEDFKKVAQPGCNGTLRPISGGIVSTGNYQYGSGYINQVNQQCMTFECR